MKSSSFALVFLSFFFCVFLIIKTNNITLDIIICMKKSTRKLEKLRKIEQKKQVRLVCVCVCARELGCASARAPLSNRLQDLIKH